MAAKPGAPVQQRLRRWLGQLGIGDMLQIALATMLAMTALFGGLDTVETKVTPIAAGEPFDDGEFTITIEKARAVDELPTSMSPRTPGRRYLGVVATVHNNGTITGQLQDEVDLRDQTDATFIGAFRMSDGSAIVQLGPKLTENLVFVWQLPEHALEPHSIVNLRVWRKTFKSPPSTLAADGPTVSTSTGKSSCR